MDVMNSGIWKARSTTVANWRSYFSMVPSEHDVTSLGERALHHAVCAGCLCAPATVAGELHTFQVMPQRWVVERSFAWLQKNRRLWKNCERLLNTRLQLIHLAFLALRLKRF